MDINNMIRNKITEWLEDIEMEEIVNEAIDSVIREYVESFDAKIQEAVEYKLKHFYDYETEIDRAIEELVDENMN